MIIKNADIKLKVKGEIVLTTVNDLKTLERDQYKKVNDALQDVKYSRFIEGYNLKDYIDKLDKAVESYNNFCKAVVRELVKDEKILGYIREDLEKNYD